MASSINYYTPPPLPQPGVSEFLAHVALIQEIKKRFLPSSQEQPLREMSTPLKATEALLTHLNRTAESFLEHTFSSSAHFTRCPPEEVAPLTQLALALIAEENAHPHSRVAYHGNRSSLVPDTYGLLAATLCLAPGASPLPRLNGKQYSHLTPEHVIRQILASSDHDPQIREVLMCVNPTCIGGMHLFGLENALVFYLEGECMDSISDAERICNNLETWGLGQPLFSPFTPVIKQLANAFPQEGYLWQIFLDPTQLSQISYPSMPLGYPILTRQRGAPYLTTDQFFHALESNQWDAIDLATYSPPDIQLRLLPDPRVFMDPSQASVRCYRKIPLDEEKYTNALQTQLVLPILAQGLTHSTPAGLFGLSELASSLGGEKPPFARLSDYLFLGTTDPRVLTAYGNEQLLTDALYETKTIRPLDTYAGITLLEIALLAREGRSFDLLFQCFLDDKLQIKEQSLVDRLLPLCYTHQQYLAVSRLLEYGASATTIISIWQLACKDNMTSLIIECTQLLRAIEVPHQDAISSLQSCFTHHNVEAMSCILEIKRPHFITGGTETTPLLCTILNHTPAHQLKDLCLVISRLGFDISQWERLLIDHARYTNMDKQHLMTYKAYYDSLDPEERQTLPLPRLWPLLSLLHQPTMDTIQAAVENESIDVVRRFILRDSAGLSTFLDYCLTTRNHAEAFTTAMGAPNVVAALTTLIPHCTDAQLSTISPRISDRHKEQVINYCFTNNRFQTARMFLGIQPFTRLVNPHEVLESLIEEIEDTPDLKIRNMHRLLIQLAGANEWTEPAHRLFQCMARILSKNSEGEGLEAFIDLRIATKRERLQALQETLARYT